MALHVSGCASTPPGPRPPPQPRRPDVVALPNGHLATVGYSEERTRSSIKAQREAMRYCWEFEGQKKPLIFSESTVYQGQFDRQISETAKVAGKVGEVVWGDPTIADAGAVLSSPSDYKTTVEFQCQ